MADCAKYNPPGLLKKGTEPEIVMMVCTAGMWTMAKQVWSSC